MPRANVRLDEELYDRLAKAAQGRHGRVEVFFRARLAKKQGLHLPAQLRVRAGGLVQQAGTFRRRALYSALKQLLDCHKSLLISR